MMENILWMGGRWILIGNVSHLFINAQECDLVVVWPWTSHLGDWPRPSCEPEEQGQEERVRYADAQGHWQPLHPAYGAPVCNSESADTD